MARDLEDQGTAGALVGGLAVSVRTEPRFTRDVDLAVAVGSDEEAERIVAACYGRGKDLVGEVERLLARR